MIGVNNAGDCSGANVKPVLDHDHAKYCDLIKKYTMQHFSDFEVVDAKRDGQAVAVFLINAPDSPLVFEKVGTCAIDAKQQHTAFSQGTVYFRHGAKSEPGTSDDIRKFIEKRVQEMSQTLVKGLRKLPSAPRGAELRVVPRGIRAISPEGAVPVRLSNNPDARGILVTDRHEMFPYRQKEVMGRLQESLPKGSRLNAYDIQAINKVYKIAGNENLSWKPTFSSRLYSDAYVEWIADHVSQDGDFLQDVRNRFRKINSKDQKAKGGV